MTSPVSSRSGFGNVNTTRNIRAVQLLLGHNKLESTVRYLGIEVDANSKTKDGFGSKSACH
jgi:site-specific recombinase XerC